MTHPIRDTSVRSGLLAEAARLTLTLCVVWAVAFWPARLLNGQTGIVWMSIAGICCLVPGWIVVMFSRLAIVPNPAAMVLLQMVARLTIVGAAAIVVRKLFPEFSISVFHGWLVVFYLAALGAEVVLLLRQPATVQ